MYELEYVRKRKRRKFVAIGAGASSVVVSTFAIVAFLGRFVGTFTVSLDTGDVQLTLSESSSFKKQSSFLRIDTLPAFQETTYLDLPSDEDLDTEKTDYLTGANYDEDEKGKKTLASLNFFKYTFYVKNIGKKAARYDLQLKIKDNRASDNGDSLVDTMRVEIFETKYLQDDSLEESQKEERVRKEVYAARAAVHHDDENGNANFQEPELTPFPGYTTMFESANVIATIPVTNFAKDDIRRYTLVAWLEGEDLQSNHNSKAPKDAKLKLGVDINAYENK